MYMYAFDVLIFPYLLLAFLQLGYKILPWIHTISTSIDSVLAVLLFSKCVMEELNVLLNIMVQLTQLSQVFLQRFVLST